MKNEAAFKQRITRELKARGAYVFAPVQTGYGERTVDMLVCFSGRFIGIEVKHGRNTPTEKQLATLKKIEAAGGIAVLAYSWDDVLKALEDL